MVGWLWVVFGLGVLCFGGPGMLWVSSTLSLCWVWGVSVNRFWPGTFTMCWLGVGTRFRMGGVACVRLGTLSMCRVVGGWPGLRFGPLSRVGGGAWVWLGTMSMCRVVGLPGVRFGPLSRVGGGAWVRLGTLSMCRVVGLPGLRFGPLSRVGGGAWVGLGTLSMCMPGVGTGFWV